MKNKIDTMIGFARKSRNIVSGEGICLEKIRSKKAKIVFLASDAGPNTEKRIIDKAKHNNIPVSRIYNRTELGKLVGTEEKVVIAVIDKGFAERIKELLGGDDSEHYQNISTCTGVEPKQQRVAPKTIRARIRSK